MIVTLPLPSEIVSVWPQEMVSFLLGFAFWSFAGLLTIPWLFCVYQLVTHQLGRTKRIKQLLDEDSAPKVVIVMPCYKEELDVLITAINSVVECDYPPSCIHVFLSFDGDQEDELYLSTIERLGVPLTLESYPKSIDIAYKDARITVSRFPHGGKRNCQKATFKLIDKVYSQYLKRNDNLFILFIDSDCILDRVCLQNFLYDMEFSPGNRRNMLAMTGVITSTTKKHSIITLLQDMEYIHGQLFERTVESGCGTVTCLPGALTMLRFSAFRRMAKYYFADKAETAEDLFDYAKDHLGEDRYLTHLFMIGAKKRYQIQMCTSAFCKTEAVQTYKSLVKQRRRWFLGFITNEACMLTDWRLWRRYPILVAYRFAQNTIRTTALLFFIMVLALLSTEKTINDLPVGFIAISLGLNWLMMIYFGAKLRRYKIWLYPMMFVLNPFFNWYYMVYGIFTAGQRTWGGPRADAGAADKNTTVQEAIEHAEQTGDDLNIVPETFIPAVLAQREGEEEEYEDQKQQQQQQQHDAYYRRPTAADYHHHQNHQEKAPIATTAAPAYQGLGSGNGGEDGIYRRASRRKSRSRCDGLGRQRSVVQPPAQVEGLFAAPQRTAGGFYKYLDPAGDYPSGDSSSSTTTNTTAAAAAMPMLRESEESTMSSSILGKGKETAATSATTTGQQYAAMDGYVVVPYRDHIEPEPPLSASPTTSMPLMSEEDRRKYEMAQATQVGSSSSSSFAAQHRSRRQHNRLYDLLSGRSARGSTSSVSDGESVPMAGYAETLPGTPVNMPGTPLQAPRASGGGEGQRLMPMAMPTEAGTGRPRRSPLAQENEASTRVPFEDDGETTETEEGGSWRRR